MFEKIKWHSWNSFFGVEHQRPNFIWVLVSIYGFFCSLCSIPWVWVRKCKPFHFHFFNISNDCPLSSYHSTNSHTYIFNLVPPLCHYDGVPKHNSLHEAAHSMNAGDTVFFLGLVSLEWPEEKPSPSGSSAYFMTSIMDIGKSKTIVGWRNQCGESWLDSTLLYS